MYQFWFVHFVHIFFLWFQTLISFSGMLCPLYDKLKYFNSNKNQHREIYFSRKYFIQYIEGTWNSNFLNCNKYKYFNFSLVGNLETQINLNSIKIKILTKNYSSFKVTHKGWDFRDDFTQWWAFCCFIFKSFLFIFSFRVQILAKNKKNECCQKC